MLKNILDVSVCDEIPPKVKLEIEDNICKKFPRENLDLFEETNKEFDEKIELYLFKITNKLKMKFE